MNAPAPRFDAALLAGGRSLRMGRDKALLDWHGMPLWRVQLAKLMDLNPRRILLSCREEQGLRCALADSVPDPPGHGGPFAALLHCLEASASGTGALPLLVLAVDMPRMTPDFLRAMLAAAGDRAAGLVCRSDHGLEPLCALYPSAALEPMRALRDRGVTRLQEAAAALVESGLMRVRVLSPGELPLFFNANTPEEYAWTQPAPPPST